MEIAVLESTVALLRHYFILTIEINLLETTRQHCLHLRTVIRTYRRVELTCTMGIVVLVGIVL